MIKIRKTDITELNTLMDIFEQGKRIMRKDGNMKQWTGGYPTEEIIKKDIENGNSYVCLDEEQNIVGTFAFIQGNDPTYVQIHDGEWIDDIRPYGVIHRLASTENSNPPACNGVTAKYPTCVPIPIAIIISCNISSRNTASNIAASSTC